MAIDAFHTGSCTCKKVRYIVTGKPMIVHACHCSWCQRQTGGPHVVNALFESESVELTQGEVIKVDTDSPSGKGQQISRCPGCHVALWSSYDFGGLGDKVLFLRVGTLDKPESMPPDIHIFTSSKMPWYVIPEGVRAVPGFYDPRTVWSAESQKRYKVLKGKLAS